MIKIFEIASENLVIDWRRAIALLIIFLFIQIIIEFIKNVIFDKKKSNNAEDLEKRKLKNQKKINSFVECYGLLRRLEMKSVPNSTDERALFKELLKDTRAHIENNYLHLKNEEYSLMCKILDMLTKKSIARGFEAYKLKIEMDKLKESYAKKC